jgi:hypothetical protein
MPLGHNQRGREATGNRLLEASGKTQEQSYPRQRQCSSGLRYHAWSFRQCRVLPHQWPALKMRQSFQPLTANLPE